MFVVSEKSKSYLVLGASMKSKINNSKPRIAYFFATLATSRFMSEHFRECARRGVESIVIAKMVSGDKLQDDVNYVCAPFSRGLNPKDLLRSIWFIFQFLRVNRDVHVVANTPICSACVAFVSFLLRRPFVFYCHGFVSTGSASYFKKKFYRLIERFTCSVATKVFFVSPSLMSYALDNGLVSDKKGYCFNGSISGVPSVEVAPRTKMSSKIKIGFLGRINEEKGVLDSISVVKELQTVYGLNVEYVLAGAIEDVRVEKALKAIGANCLGYIEDKAQFFSEIDVLLFPSQREGFGMAPLEAAAHGVPTIGYDIVGLRDSVISGETGWLCPLGNKSLLTVSIMRYVHDSTMYARHSAAALNRARCMFDRDKVIEDQLAALDDIFKISDERS